MNRHLNLNVSKNKAIIIALFSSMFLFASSKSLIDPCSKVEDGFSKKELTQKIGHSLTPIEGIFKSFVYNNQHLGTILFSDYGGTKEMKHFHNPNLQKDFIDEIRKINFETGLEIHSEHNLNTTESIPSMRSFTDRVAIHERITSMRVMPIQNTNSFSGEYSNETDTTAKGILSFRMMQLLFRIEGTAIYQSFDNSINSGLLSVNGYVKNGIAYVKFKDQKGNLVAKGALHFEGQNIIFRQTTLSNIVPHYAILNK